MKKEFIESPSDTMLTAEDTSVFAYNVFPLLGRVDVVQFKEVSAIIEASTRVPWEHRREDILAETRIRGVNHLEREGKCSSSKGQN